MLCQPPSGGCVLKHRNRLLFIPRIHQPPSGGCVLKQGNGHLDCCLQIPAAFRRLCVETIGAFKTLAGIVSSRLQAAVC